MLLVPTHQSLLHEQDVLPLLLLKLMLAALQVPCSHRRQRLPHHLLHFLRIQRHALRVLLLQLSCLLAQCLVQLALKLAELRDAEAHTLADLVVEPLLCMMAR